MIWEIIIAQVLVVLVNNMIIIIILSIVILIILGIFSVRWYTRDTYIVRVKKGTIMDFKSAVDLTGVPMITFTQGDKKYNFIVDTGSNVSYINQAAGMEYTPIEGSKETFIGAGGNGNAECSLGMLKLTRGDREFNFRVRVADLSAALNDFQQTFGVHAHGLLGNDIMTDHQYCIDFKEFIIYERK